MDEHLRALERRAATGDDDARVTLEAAWDRLGLGWHGEVLVRGLLRAGTRGVYAWRHPVLDLTLALVRVGAPGAGFWIGRRPVTCLEYDVHKLPINGRERDRPPSPFGRGDDDPRCARWGQADDFCRQAGLRLPDAVELEVAGRGSVHSVEGLWEWSADAVSAGRVIVSLVSGQRSAARPDDHDVHVGFRPALSDPRGMTDEPIAHITTRADWEVARSTGRIAPASLATEGFVHCSAPAQVAETAGRYFAGRRDVVVLEVDPRRLRARLVWEGPRGVVGATPPSAERSAQLFPHVYGPIELDAVVGVHDLALRDDGSFALRPRSRRARPDGPDGAARTRGPRHDAGGS